MEINRIPSKDSLVRCLDADRRVGTADRDHDHAGIGKGVLAVGHTQGQQTVEVTVVDHPRLVQLDGQHDRLIDGQRVDGPGP